MDTFINRSKLSPLMSTFCFYSINFYTPPLASNSNSNSFKSTNLTRGVFRLSRAQAFSACEKIGKVGLGSVCIAWKSLAWAWAWAWLVKRRGLLKFRLHFAIIHKRASFFLKRWKYYLDVD